LPGLLIAFAAMMGPARAASLEFNRDIRPILSENCFYCHGQDESRREAKLRLDVRESAVTAREGIAAIVPGKPDESELVRRIAAKDPNDVMPPPESHKSLTLAQVELLTRWVREGATYQGHWAFLAPERAPVPTDRRAGARGDESKHAIDAFVRARLTKEGLRPSGPAAPGVWLRRVSLDLTGLPPTVAEMDRFEAEVAARGEPAYAAAVDRLLASAHYGERMAMEWLDAARYADTHGFNNDTVRVMWRWRDWVIGAFNSNLRYDRFVTEQLAGDLLPKPTLEQRIATGFNRNHVISSEGGIIDEEYRVEYVADRVRTMSTAWLGLTFECARCHDHKFDPIAQKDYYRLFAFFNNVQEHGEDGRVANAVPMMPAPTREQQTELAKQERALAALDTKLDAARAGWRGLEGWKKEIETLRKAATQAVQAEKGAVMLLEPVKEKPVEVAQATAEEQSGSGDAETPKKAEVDPSPKIPAAKMEFSNKDGLTMAFWLRTDAENPRDVALFSSMDYSGSKAGTGYRRGREIRLVDGELELRWAVRFPAYSLNLRSAGVQIRPGEWRHVAFVFTGGTKAAEVRLLVDGREVGTNVLYDGLNGPGPKREFLIGTDGSKNAPRLVGKLEDARSYPRVLSDATVQALFRVRALADAGAAAESDEERARRQSWVRDAVLAQDAAWKEIFAEREALQATHLALRRSLPTVMTMQEMPQTRKAFVLNRGQYDARGEEVEPGVPEELLGAWPQGAPRNRLGLAQWLTSARHPLTARVVVNRLWAQFFGTGIVKTLEDFGSQSEWPSHPELLDWLAREFVDSGWDLKALVRTIVLSATYRQSSAVTPALVARDPENRLLARGPRVRLAAEMIRDQALAVSGLLTPKIGGPSVYPYQPDKLFETVVVGSNLPGTTWPKSSESDLYRRSMYTFWKRTMPHPAMTTFDAPDREFCTVRRSRTNTPLQALVLWNEPGLVEAARKLGTRMLREAPGDDAGRVGWAFQAATGRRPQQEETAVLVKTWNALRKDFAAKPDEAAALLTVGESAIDGSVAEPELAAATALANVILGLDEVISKN
jgi:hypothetical protein